MHQYHFFFFLKDPDTSPPSCSAARVESACSSLCNESSWTVYLAVSDRGRSGLAALQLQRGEGTLTLFHSPPPTEDGLDEAQPPHRARLERGEPPLNVSEWVVGSAQPLWVSYTSDCCSVQAELLVWDTAGNMKRCHLTSGQQRHLRDQSREVSSAGWITCTTGVFYLIWGLLWSSMLLL